MVVVLTYSGTLPVRPSDLSSKAGLAHKATSHLGGTETLAFDTSTRTVPATKIDVAKGE